MLTFCNSMNTFLPTDISIKKNVYGKTLNNLPQIIFLKNPPVLKAQFNLSVNISSLNG